jgi:hypothetical protein
MMDDLTQRLIQKAPALLVGIAIALFIGSLVNAFSTIQSVQGQGINLFQYIFSFIFSALYQPAILIAWAAAVHYLSLIAMRRV